MKCNIIYYSTTGNTEQMAMYIEEGVKETGIDAEIISIDNVDNDSLDADYFMFGSSATGAEEPGLEIVEYIDDNIEKFVGKTVGLFGSYDWGAEEWMDNWVSDLENKGIQILENGLRINLTPDDDEKIEMCREYGRKMSFK